MEIMLGDYNIKYEIIRKNNKNIYFRFKDGTLCVTANRFISESEVRRLIQQGGLSLNGDKVTDFKRALTEEDFADGSALVKRGKKNYHKIELA